MTSRMFGNKFSFKHGMSFTPEYESWTQMRKRCLQPKNKDYANYGGRGIVICYDWSKFLRFYEDMGVRPDGMTLERRDVNGDYTPANCYWATVPAQNRNKRTSIRIQFACQSMTLKEACRLAEVSYAAIWHRMRRHGLTFYQALDHSEVGRNAILW